MVKCGQCDKSCWIADELKAHMIREHTDHLICSKCEREFKTHEDRYAHRRLFWDVENTNENAPVVEPIGFDEVVQNLNSNQDTSQAESQLPHTVKIKNKRGKS